MQKQAGIYPPMVEIPLIAEPQISSTASVGQHATIVGDVTIEKDVFVGFHAIIRSPIAYPIYVGPRTNLQDFTLIHSHPGQFVDVHGRQIGVYFEGDVSVRCYASVHGPLFVGRNTFIGQNAAIYGAVIGRNCVIMRDAIISNIVTIADDRFVGTGQAVFTQEQADQLPSVPERYRELNPQVVDHYIRLGRSIRTQKTLFE